jgi:glycosyltransferase involved in cell wall biosynthesis
MKKTRILYLHSSNELYGADRSLFRLVRELDRERFTPIVAISSDVNYEQRLLSSRLKGISIQTFTLPLAVLRRKYFNAPGLIFLSFLLPFSTIKLAHIIRSLGIDIIHTNSSAVLSGGFAALIARRPHIWHVREIYTAPRLLGKIVARTVSRFSARVIAVSGAVRDQLIDDGCDPEKVIVIHNGIDLDLYGPKSRVRDRIRTELGIPPQAMVVGMIGRISSWKGQEVLVQAAQLVVEKQPLTFFVLGGGVIPWEEFRRRDLLQLIDQLQLTKHVILEDFRTDVPDFLTAFDLFVLPSTRPDPYPTVVLEAMATGLPVIATDWGGVVEMVEETSGRLVPPNDPEALAAAILDLLQNPQAQTTMGYAARAQAQAEFSTHAYVTAVERQYDQFLGQI